MAAANRGGRSSLLFGVILLATAALAALPAEARSPASDAVRQGTVLLGQGDPTGFGRAETLFRQAVSAAPDLTDARLGLAYTLLLRYLADPDGGQEGLEEALLHVDQALELQPALADGWRKKSVILYHLGRSDEGLSALDEALGRFPGTFELYEAKLAYLVNTGKRDEAIAFFSRGDFPTEDQAGLLYRFGEAWYGLGEPFLARVAFSRSIDIQESAEAHEMIARTFVSEENWEKAVAAFQWALTVDPDYTELYEDIALCYARLEKTEEAIRYLKTYTDSFPDDLTARKDLALLFEHAGNTIKARLIWMKIRTRATDRQEEAFASRKIEELKGER